MQRKNAGRVGVYYRHAKNRIGPDGKPDKCYDILYKINGKTVFEKIGWLSEGYSLEDAVTIRGTRVKALRHPELCPEEAEKIVGVQLDVVWEMYKQRWLPSLKRQDNIVGNYERHIRPAFGHRAVASIEIGEVEDFKNRLLTQVSPVSGKVLTPGTVKIVLGDLRRIINKGLAWGMLKKEQNAASKIRVNDADRQRERFLSPEEAEKLLDCLQYISCNLYYIVKIALYTGMRLSEVLNLRWQNIDLV